MEPPLHPYRYPDSVASIVLSVIKQHLWSVSSRSLFVIFMGPAVLVTLKIYELVAGASVQIVYGITWRMRNLL